jgi:hypothetical protein
MFVFLFDYVVLHPSKVSLLLCPIIAQLSAQILQFFFGLNGLNKVAD